MIKTMSSKFSRKMIYRPKFYAQLNYQSSRGGIKTFQVGKKIKTQQNSYSCESFRKRLLKDMHQQNERGNPEGERHENQKTWNQSERDTKGLQT